ncbi:MAG: hypothetical protein WCF90_01285 [Methanomicrobiales archaeon]
MKAEVYEQTPSESSGKDSYAYYTGSGGSIHLGPIDMGYLMTSGATVVGAFFVWLAAINGLIVVQRWSSLLQLLQCSSSGHTIVPTMMEACISLLRCCNVVHSHCYCTTWTSTGAPDN